jgi:hypothetical protein
MVSGAKKVINNPDEVVYEALDGFVQSNPGVVRLDGFPDVSPFAITQGVVITRVWGFVSRNVSKHHACLFYHAG